ncbi:uncharacterized protein LOC113279812 [Papaver somniferum]|uniref:uncharacterized protein LOC113279812 n=1 Tax=Papaver somniferum TaxID=3469 RepID=UPI000E701C9D|nr:uncharacterized protein LOC113279812 [Papaver somniferum]
MIVIMKCLCKAVPPDSIEDYTAMGACTIYRYPKRFLDALMYGFNDKYMRRPSQDDTGRLLRDNAVSGFPGMLGSIDCLHWKWMACPTYRAGQHYSGHKRAPTVILEEAASFDRWFWHGYFEKPGSNNDINVLNHSDVFDNVNNGVTPRWEYEVNGHRYTEGYYLADGIYPRYKVLVASYKEATLSRKKKLLNTYQESKRKDAERALSTMKRKFAIVKNPCMYWKKSDMKSIMRGCMIMHNMVVENKNRA